MEDGPDLLVYMFFGVMDEQSVQNITYYGPRTTAYEYHDGEWERMKRTGVITQEDHEGTLIVDLAESSKKELVWRAVIRAVLGDYLEKNFETANKGIVKAFKNYPPEK